MNLEKFPISSNLLLNLQENSFKKEKDQDGPILRGESGEEIRTFRDLLR